MSKPTAIDSAQQHVAALRVIRIHVQNWNSRWLQSSSYRATSSAAVQQILNWIFATIFSRIIGNLSIVKLYAIFPSMQ
jgi:hypothetical protein